MQKDERHRAILTLIADSNIRRQDELARSLSESGFDVTQASVSRDLDELGIAKVAGVYTIPQHTAGTPVFGRVLIETAGDVLLVLKCASGLASAAAVTIDAAKLDGIVGTIAGDDTIFVAVADSLRQKTVAKSLRNIFDTHERGEKR